MIIISTMPKKIPCRTDPVKVVSFRDLKTQKVCAIYSSICEAAKILRVSHQAISEAARNFEKMKYITVKGYYFKKIA